ncbi:MAG: ABC transporter substrate-binding protein [Chloroflexaceae bacterium]|nr:ABC transporter substrate-binding protein [Chloroflexaceae bacterium]
MIPLSHVQRFLLTVTVFLLVLAACSSQQSEPAESPQSGRAPVLPEEVIGNEAERRQTVIWDLSSGPIANPEQWNPLARDGRRDKGLHQSMIEPLFILNYESGVIEPWLGERMTANDDQDSWTLKLRDGVTWSDGEAFDADDVVFTVNLVLENPDLELDFFAGFTSWVERVEKVDDLTVVFHLVGPNPRFQLDFFSVKVWGSFDVMPEHIWRDKDPYTFTNYDPEQGWPVFTGPYKLESFTDQTTIYVRDDNWWGAKTGFRPLPQPKRLIWSSFDIGDDALAVTQHLDSIGNSPLETFEAVKAARPNLITWLDGVPFAWMDPCSRLLTVNTMVPPWDDKDMRWAINAVIDRDALVQDAYDSTTIVSRHFFPAYPPLERYVQLLEQEGLYDEYPLMQRDPARAEQIIESKGWQKGTDGYYEQDGERLSFTIYAHEASPEMRRAGEQIAGWLEAIGVQSEMIPLSETDWVAHKTTGDFDGIIDWDACGSINEPWASMDRYHNRWVKPIDEPVSNYNNQGRWDNAAYSAIVDEMAALPLGDPAIDDLFVEAMAIWLDELPFIPLVQDKQLISFDTTYWQGWPTATNNYVHPPSWWQSAHIIIHHLEPTEQSAGR